MDVIGRPATWLLLHRLMALCGHGELLMLFGILMTAGGYNSFELVGLKGDLGALAFGWLLAAYPKASELTDRLKHFETATRLPGDEPIETGDASVAIIGLGGVGSSA
ncbi:MAG: cation:proton antiporter [Desulfobacterales bacterium]|jgi:predicted Kef-type K+ transport protein